MSSYIDTKYINLLSPRLERFHWKKNTLAVCRCPVCGDSSKSKSKVRFYFYEKGGGFFVRCHNCDYSTTLGGFIKKMDVNLHKQYCFENLKEKGVSHKREEPKPKKKRFSENAILEDFASLDELPCDHVAVIWADERQIPKAKRGLLYYTNDFAAFVAQIDPTAKVGDDERIIIPIFSSSGILIGAQGRLLSGKTIGREIRYITIKTDKDGDRLWYGLDRVDRNDTIVAVEGPIDSLFLRNSIAMLGLSDPLNLPDRLSPNKIVYALDNEPRNKQVVEAMSSLIDAGRKVCIWDNRVAGIKDINDMIRKGFKSSEVEEIVRQSTHEGLSAKLALSLWKRV